MNQLFNVSILIILVSISACDNAENLIDNLVSYEASAVINGERWDAEPGEVIFINEVEAQTGITTLAILLNGDTSFFTFTIVEPEETTYSIGESIVPPVVGLFFIDVNHKENFYQLETGTFSIDRLEEDLVSGSFEGTFRHATNDEVLDITDGTLYLPMGEAWFEP